MEEVTEERFDSDKQETQTIEPTTEEKNLKKLGDIEDMKVPNTVEASSQEKTTTANSEEKI